MAYRDVTLHRRAVLAACLAAPLLQACSGRERRAEAEATRALARRARAGDLVFRVGAAPESYAVRAVSARPFSHVGVLTGKPGAPVVIHASPPDRSGAGGVIASQWNEFGLADDVDAVRVYRLAGLTNPDRVRLERTAHSMLGRPFDGAFRLAAQDGSIYCTLLALRCVASVDPNVFRYVRARSVPMFEEPVYLPESLLAWPRLHPV